MSSPPLPRRPPRTRRRKHLIAEHLPRLAESARGLARDEKLVREMVETCLKLLRNGTPVGDIKILNAALRELRYAFKVFAPYRNVRKVSVFGSARSARESSACRTAFEFAQRIRDAGYMVITGAGHGIMGACQEGAGPDHSFGVNIRLPFEQGPNEVIAKDPKLLTFRYFFTRKLIFIKEADAAALFPGGFGTHDEAYECLTLVQTGKTKPMPIVFLDAPRGTYWKTWKRYVEEHLLRHRLISPEDMALFKVTSSVDEAVEEITRFYRVYHSARTVDRNLVIRLTHRIPESLVTQLGHDFADIVVKGEIVQTGALEEEREDAPELVRLPRLVLEFNRSSFGRLRQLIDRLNSDG
ncbi:MAG: TIGR00730 family Rossman fold protein [Deltaproteobacteria bacterium]|nr:MAG: TIGR00730 family Rossman fold protein [Deltaproteobacteria bacterium]TMB18549.1 MAG: TIGR00730 family Rossman fold protein [Deltaproteobacteria bacterium]